MSSSNGIVEAALVLSDGTLFEGEAFGAMPAGGVASGEVVFNTVLSGYQEVITDPSYAGQIVTFTYPHLGNYGINSEDHESRKPFLRGVIARDIPRRHSNWRSETDLNSYLVSQGVPGIGGLDTRRLTRHIRDTGAMPGAFGTADEATLRAAATAEKGTDGIDMVATVTCDSPYQVAYQDHDPRSAVAAGRCHGRSSVYVGSVDPGAGPRRHLLVERPRRPRGGCWCHRHHCWSAWSNAGVRHLSGTPAVVADAGARSLQASVRPSRR